MTTNQTKQEYQRAVADFKHSIKTHIAFTGGLSVGLVLPLMKSLDFIDSLLAGNPVAADLDVASYDLVEQVASCVCERGKITMRSYPNSILMSAVGRLGTALQLAKSSRDKVVGRRMLLVALREYCDSTQEVLKVEYPIEVLVEGIL